MGRPIEVADPVSITVRVGKAVLAMKPAKYGSYAVWIRDVLTGKAEEMKASLSPEVKAAIKLFYDLFSELFSKGELDKYLDRPGLIESAKLFAEAAR